jgi:microsomal dipeptidase-like Zn-dependent dipeptidase
MKLKTVAAVWFLMPLATLATFSQQATKPADEQILKKAKAIHERAITIDSHVDISGPQYATPQLDPGAENSPLRCDLTKMEKGGMKGEFLAAFVGQRGGLDEQGYKAAYEAAMGKIEAVHRLTEKMYPNRCQLATSPVDVERIARAGKRAIMIGMENGYPIGTDLSLVKKYYDLGVRYVTLSHSGHNQICDSSGPKEPMHNGLSEFGKKVVAEMNRLGMMVDVSHISEKSFFDVLKLTSAPVIASHSGCMALNVTNRNLTDEQLRALAKNGGVVQVVALADFLKSDSPERLQAIEKSRAELGVRAEYLKDTQSFQESPSLKKEIQAMNEQQRAEYNRLTETLKQRMKDIDAKYPPASVKDLANHIDHAVKIAGIDHVGFGGDMEGPGGIGGIPGFSDYTEAMNLTVELVRRGYSEQDIDKIWGGNLLRVWREVEGVAAKSEK